MYEVRNFFYRSYLMKFYKVYGKPIIEYRLLVYVNCSQLHLKRIKAIQNGILKTILYRRKIETISVIMEFHDNLSVPKLFQLTNISGNHTALSEVSHLNFLFGQNKSKYQKSVQEPKY